ncbi:MAG: Hsp20/alpha crystallin family protein [Balneolaceae bacterium]|nr:Hsp20/alpha crystallin family protein [Balneolaceae bacterium]
MSEFTIDIERQLNKLGKDIQQMVGRIVPLEDKGQDFRPQCDIIESEDTYKIVLDIPGLSKNEVNVSLKDYVLTVRGERVDELDEDEVYRRQERASGVFSRSFALPQNVVADEVDAAFRTGVLTISMPKTGEHEDSTNIPIN